MMNNRRQFLYTAGFAASTCGFLGNTRQPSTVDERALQDQELPVQFALNTSTIMGQKLTIEQQIDVAAKAGYDAIEPWIRDLQAYVERGGELSSLKRRIEDAGLSVVSAIGFPAWIVNDDTVRRQGLEQARSEMELVKAIGGSRVAAPPVGIRDDEKTNPSLAQIGERYRALLKVGAETDVVPQLELWGHSLVLSKLEQLAYVATAAAHPDACVLPDFYHVYKGGNDFAALAMIEASKMHCFHINDYPANPPQDKINDRDRVFPGDGVCPLPQIIGQLIKNGFRGTFSLELFNPEYWKRDASEVAVEGLKKSKAVVRQSLQANISGSR